MNKFLVIGLVLLLGGIAAYYIIDTTKFGFWIAAVMGAGSILMITGIFKKFR